MLYCHLLSFCGYSWPSDYIFAFLTAILLSIIYIEVCRRLGLTIVGSRVGEDFLIWPQMGNPEVRKFSCASLKYSLATHGSC